jgi:hypothetical protein
MNSGLEQKIYKILHFVYKLIITVITNFTFLSWIKNYKTENRR